MIIGIIKYWFDNQFNIYLPSTFPRSNAIKFPLTSGWALKEKQKYGKRGVRKRITKKVRTILEGYFLAGNVNKSDRYTAQDMHQALQEKVLEGEIESDIVPKISTIQNWIARYTREHREQAARTNIST